jgi:pimeloyl-ACP methyl ester carboxylesterase
MEAIVRSIPVYYEEYGTGIPILMIHGMPSDHHHMIDVMEPLFQHRTGWRRIYPDVPGMGKTPGAAWITNNDQMLEVISEFMQTVAPNQRFIVTGLSYGGYYARGLIYQQCSMIDGLLLVVPVGIPEMTKRQVPPHLLLVKDDQFLSALTPGDTEVFTNLFVVQSVEGLEWFRTNFQVPFDAADHVFWHIPGVTSF